MPRPGKTLGQPILRWLGKRKKCLKQNPITKTSTTFEAVQFNDVTIRVGDFVLVNADADENDVAASCDVARIEHLFEDTQKSDRFRANVQWYSKPPRIPHYIDIDHMDEEHEVVEDYRKFNNNVNVESIYKTCSVINAYEDDIPEHVRLKVKDRTMPAFVCRYRLDRKNDKFYVEPVLKLDVLNPEDSSLCSGSVDVGSRQSYRYLPNTIIEEAPVEGTEIKSERKSSKAKTPKSGAGKESQAKIEAKLRSALRKCSIDSDSEAPRYSSPGKRNSSINQDSDFENSPRSTPKKNTLRSSKKSETPLKSNRINTLPSRLHYSNDGHKESTRDSYDVVEGTPVKNEPATSSRKRRISSTSSEESLEPRSRSVSPEIDRLGPPAAFKLYETNGQTLVIKTPVSIEKKGVSKKLNEKDIAAMLSSGDSDNEAILEKFEKNGTKIVARSKSDNTGFELLKTPNKNVNFLDDNGTTETPESARRNLSGILNSGDRTDARKDLLLKKTR